jgi:hypothetical protein
VRKIHGYILGLGRRRRMPERATGISKQPAGGGGYLLDMSNNQQIRY